MVASWLGLAVIAVVKALCSACLKAPAIVLAGSDSRLLHPFAEMGLLRRMQRITVIVAVAFTVVSVRGDTAAGSDGWLRPLVGRSAFAIPGTYVNVSPGRANPAWSRDAQGQVVIDIPPDRGEVLYAVGFDRTLNDGEVLVQVGADRPMSIEAFIETERADWRSRHSVVLRLDGSGLQTFVVPLSRFKQAYYTSGELLGVHFPESVRRSLPGIEPGSKAYAAGIVVNGFPEASTPSQILTQGTVTLRRLAQHISIAARAAGSGQEWMRKSPGGNAFDLPGTFRWEDRKQAGVAVVSTWSRDEQGHVVGVIAQGQGEVQYGRAIDEDLDGETIAVEIGSSLAQMLSIYVDPIPGNVRARRFAHIELKGGELQKITIPLSEFGLSKGTRIYQVGIRDVHEAAHTLTLGRIGCAAASKHN